MAWRGAPAPQLRLLPERITLAEIIGDRPEPGIVLGVDEARLAPIVIDPETQPLLYLYGDSGAGKTTMLKAFAAEVARSATPDRAKIFVVDPRRSLLGAIDDRYLGAYLASPDQMAGGMTDLAAYLKGRLPGTDITQEQLRTRSWWTGADAYILVDDYDLVAGQGGTPLQPLVPLLAQASDLGLRLVVTRRIGGAARAAYDPVLQRFGDLGATGILLSGSPDEDALIGKIKPQIGVPGRAQVVLRGSATLTAQLAWIE